MAMPSVQDVYDETDRAFREKFPDAPEHLDPQDPEQAQFVQDWGEIRVEVTDRWTNDVFFQFFPIGRPIDPNDPNDATYVQYWLDIRTQLHGDAGQYDWSGSGPAAPVAPAAGSGADHHADPSPGAAPHTDAEPAEAPAGTVGPPARGNNMTDEELVASAFSHQLAIIRQWQTALITFDKVMTSSTRSEEKADFAGALIDLFEEKALGKFAEVAGAELVFDSLKAVIDEAKRAKEAATSVALRDFVNDHRTHLANLDRLLSLDAPLLAADARAKAEELQRNNPDGYGMFRLYLSDLFDDASGRLAGASQETIIERLTEMWVADTVSGNFWLRINESDLSVRDVKLIADDGDKLLERLLAEPGGLDVWPLKVPKVVIFFEGDSAAGEVHLDASNRDVTPPAAKTSRTQAVFTRLHENQGFGRLGPQHAAD